MVRAGAQPGGVIHISGGYIFTVLVFGAGSGVFTADRGFSYVAGNRGGAAVVVYVPKTVFVV